MKPAISIIVCTYNRDKYSYNVLKSIADNEFPHTEYEIVLVNNNSTDNTESECKRFQQDYPTINFHYFVETNQGLSYARNCGIQNAQGDILVYVDDDATVNKEYIKTYVSFFLNNPDVDAAGGPIIPVYETVEPKWMSYYTRQLITGKLLLGNKPQEFPHKAFPGGGNAAYRKTVFDKVGFFNVQLGRKGKSLIGAEEKDIFDKMTQQGMRFYYLPNAILYHIIPDNKLTKEYFNRLTYSIGVSEHYRTLTISHWKFVKRLMSESIKWAASFLLWLFFALQLQIAKGNKLIVFRYQVTRGLLIGKMDT